ncbi:MAG: GNAT family N-acetyltransferase, partial [Nanoarchaeota archaeon]
MTSMASMSNSPVILRLIDEKDSLDIFNWRNDPVTVKFSTTGKVEWSQHQAWFPKKIKDLNTCWLILTNSTQEKIGMVRFDKEDKNIAVVSINLNPAFRSQGYGQLSLERSIQYYFKKCQKESGGLLRLKALIHPDNLASHRLFRSCGFKEEGKEREEIRYFLTEEDFNSKRIKIGLKLWSSNVRWFAEAKERFQQQEFDFLELYVVPGTFNPEKLSLLREIPVDIHVPIEEEFNLLAKREKNFTLMEEAQKFADFFHSEYIIIHPGRGEKMDIPINNWNLLHDPRIIIENVPVKPIGGGIPLQGYNYEQLQELLEKSGKGFCLDLAHAFKAAK